MNIKKYCFHCKKKLTIIEIELGKCKCNNIYCKKHKQCENHICDYDYRNIKYKEENIITNHGLLESL